MKKSLANTFKRIHSTRVLHYLIAGGCSFLIEYLIFLFLFYVAHLNPGLSSAIGFLCGLISSFTLNRFFVFKVRAKRAKIQILSFFALGFANLIITSLLVDLLVHLNIPAYIAKIGTMILVVMWNFVVMKKLIFRQQP